MTTLGALLDRGAQTLARTGIPAPLKEAQRILADVLGIDPAALLGRPDEAAAPGTINSYLSKVEQRAGHAPLSQVLGYRDFWRHRFRVTPAVLDPRPETETLVAMALELPMTRLLDLGTGSGCIAISVLAERAEATAVATDISVEALEIAEFNALDLGVADRLAFVHADWGAGLSGPFDLIVSNPPYIAVDEIAGLAPEVRDFEPHAALTDGGDGLGAYRRIAADAPRLLAPGGSVAVEIGLGQEHDVQAIFVAAGLEPTGLHPDLAGRIRVVSARLRP
ncbi:MAG: peptide chain release factor N(5)-glutamine methyltransferase [Pseudomonadota bacterium]